MSVPFYIRLLRRGSLPARLRWTDRYALMRGITYALFFFSAFTIAGVTAATVLLYLLVLYHVWRSPQDATAQALPGWVLVALLALPAAALVSALANPDPLGNVANLRREYSYFLPLALLPALAGMDLRRLLLVLAAPVALMAIYAVIQHYWGVDWLRPEGHKLVRPFGRGADQVFYGQGTFSHHLTFSGYMLLNAVLFAGLARGLRGRERWLWAAVAAFAGVGVLVALGRSGWAGMAVGLILVIVGFPRRVWLPVGLVVAFIGLAALTVTTGWLRALPEEAQPQILRRAAATSLRFDRERLYLWESALRGIADRPVLGVGYGNDKHYMAPYRKAVSEDRNYRFSVRASTHSHNVYLQVAFELGLLGLASYLLLWGAVLYWCGRWVRRAGDVAPFETALLGGVAAALVGSMVAGVFENNFFDAEVRTMILMCLGLGLHAGLTIRRRLAEAGHGDPAS